MPQETTRAPEHPLRFDGPTTGSATDAGPSGAMSCAQCGTAIGAYYYEAGGAVYCARCKRVAEEAAGAGTRGGVNFGRAVAFGLGAALVSAIGWALFIHLTGFNVGIIAIGVAAFIATAVLKGSGGHRGRRYQLMAVALTYLAVSAARIPFVVAGFAEVEADRGASPAMQADSTADASEAAADVEEVEPEGSDSAPVSASGGGERAPEDRPSTSSAVPLLVGAVVVLLLAPVLQLGATSLSFSIFGTLINGFALLQAWRMTGGEGTAPGGHLTFTGPYKVAERPSSSPAGATG